MNTLRGDLAEFGAAAPQGVSRVVDLVVVLIRQDEATLPPLVRLTQRSLAAELGALSKRVDEIKGQRLCDWLEDCNIIHPHSGLRFQSPRVFIQERSNHQAVCPVEAGATPRDRFRCSR